MHLRPGAPRLWTQRLETQRLRTQGLWIVPFTVALLAAACSGSATTRLTEPVADGDTAPTVAGSTTQVEPTAEPTTQTEPTAEPAPEPTATPEPTPTPDPTYFSTGIEPGDCFTRLPGNPSFQPPDKVSCDELHEEEVYAKAVLGDPVDALYPGQDALAERASNELCDAATLDFAGEPWDLVAMGTRLLFPDEEEWAAGDRTIMCSATSSTEGVLKLGTAAGGSIDADDVLMVRSGLKFDGVDFADWTIMTEHATIDSLGSLTDGQFDLPLRRAFPVPVGFIFNAKAAGDEGHATATWGYNWQAQEFTDLGSILPGQELASTIVTDDGVIFAARATPSDDYDLWTTASGDTEILIGGDGDQHFATLTPDRTQLVYQDNGDLWVANVDGSNPVQLTSGPATDWESTVSPDGDTVVFASNRSGNDDLWAIDITGGEPVNLTNHPADESWPVFSEDGSVIYFGSDRLAPEDDRPIVMVMNPDGSNQSWFAGANGSQHIVVPRAVADQVLASAPTLNERYNYELIEGEPGTTETWTHSTGRLTVDLPAGWRVGEFNETTGFIAGPRPDQYFEIWEVDGVAVDLWDGETEDTFFAIFEESTAVQSCDQFDGTDGIVPIAEGVVGISANFNCGDDGAVGGVIAFYNQTTGVGVIIQGQRDNLPDADTDSELITAIARSLVWE